MQQPRSDRQADERAEAWKLRALAAERALTEFTVENIDRHRSTIEALEPYWD